MYDPRYDYPPDPSILAPTQPVYNAQGMESVVQKQLHQQQHLYYSHALQSMGLYDMVQVEAYAARNSPSYGALLNTLALPLPSRQDRVPEATHPRAYQLQEQGYTPRIGGLGAPSLSTGLPMSAIDNPQSYFIPLVLTHFPTPSPDSWGHTPPSMLSSPPTLTSSPDSFWDSDIVGQPSPPWPTVGEVAHHDFAVANTPNLPSTLGNSEAPGVPVAAAASGRFVLTPMQLGLSTPQAKIEAARRSRPPPPRLIGPTVAGLDHQNICLDRAQGPHVPREAQDARPAGTNLKFVVGSQLLAIQGSIPAESDSIPSSTSMLNSVGLAVQRDKNTITPIAPQINPWVGVPAAMFQTRPSSVQQVATGRVPAARNRARYNPVAGLSSLLTTTPRLAKTAPAVTTSSSTPPQTTLATSNPTALGRQSFNAPWHDDTKMRKLAVASDYLRSLAPEEYRAPDGTFFCPFAQCSKQASGIATELNLLWHIVRCGDPTQCKLCNKKLKRGHTSYEMHRHRRGGMGRGVKGTSKRNDCRVPCAYIKGNCGTVDSDTGTIYNHMVEDGILDSVIDDPQLGSKTDMLGPRLRAFRALLQQQIGSGDETVDTQAA